MQDILIATGIPALIIVGLIFIFIKESHTMFKIAKEIITAIKVKPRLKILFIILAIIAVALAIIIYNCIITTTETATIYPMYEKQPYVPNFGEIYGFPINWEGDLFELYSLTILNKAKLELEKAEIELEMAVIKVEILEINDISDEEYAQVLEELKQAGEEYAQALEVLKQADEEYTQALEELKQSEEDVTQAKQSLEQAEFDLENFVNSGKYVYKYIFPDDVIRDKETLIEIIDSYCTDLLKESFKLDSSSSKYERKYTLNENMITISINENLNDILVITYDILN